MTWVLTHLCVCPYRPWQWRARGVPSTFQSLERVIAQDSYQPGLEIKKKSSLHACTQMKKAKYTAKNLGARHLFKAKFFYKKKNVLTHVLHFYILVNTEWRLLL